MVWSGAWEVRSSEVKRLRVVVMSGMDGFAELEVYELMTVEGGMLHCSVHRGSVDGLECCRWMRFGV